MGGRCWWCSCLSGSWILHFPTLSHSLCYHPTIRGREDPTFSHFNQPSRTLQCTLPYEWEEERWGKGGRAHCPVSGANPGRCIPTIPYHTLPTLPYLTHIRHHTWWGESRRLLRPHSIVPSHVIWHRPLELSGWIVWWILPSLDPLIV